MWGVGCRVKKAWGRRAEERIDSYKISRSAIAIVLFLHPTPYTPHPNFLRLPLD
ncbi:MAG: hypothetical protein F6J93_10475 [Oscillatoria sp. SIO1A7]|nr:hypothetical protein [Oscillatoria sp. SIO1A7]